jgi:hypothetical protein
MTDYKRATLKVHLDNGDTFTTGFNILEEMLKERTVQDVVDRYYINRNYYTTEENAHRITRVDVLDVIKVA